MIIIIQVKIPDILEIHFKNKDCENVYDRKNVIY